MRDETTSYYKSGKYYEWDDAYGHVIGILRFGEWDQDGSGGREAPVPCFGWYVEAVKVSLHETIQTENADFKYPGYLKRQSVKFLEKNPTYRPSKYRKPNIVRPEEEKQQALQKYIHQRASASEICLEFDITRGTLYRWVRESGVRR